jgi:hypothetical protein
MFLSYLYNICRVFLCTMLCIYIKTHQAYAHICHIRKFMCVFVCVHKYENVCVFLCALMNVYINTLKYTCLHKYRYTFIYATHTHHLHTYIRNMHTQTHEHIITQAHRQTDSHTHINTFKHGQARRVKVVPTEVCFCIHKTTKRKFNSKRTLFTMRNLLTVAINVCREIG